MNDDDMPEFLTLNTKDMTELMDVLGKRLDTLEEKMDAIIQQSSRVEKLASTVASQVKPVLDDLMKSPLLRMLGVKK